MPKSRVKFHWLLAVIISLGVAWYTQFGTDLLRPPETRFIGLWRIDLQATLNSWARQTKAKRADVALLGATVSESLSHFRYRFTEDGRIYHGHTRHPNLIAQYRVLGHGEKHVDLHLIYQGLRRGQTEQGRVEYAGGGMSLLRGKHRVVLVRD